MIQHYCYQSRNLVEYSQDTRSWQSAKPAYNYTKNGNNTIVSTLSPGVSCIIRLEVTACIKFVRS